MRNAIHSTLVAAAVVIAIATLPQPAQASQPLLPHGGHDQVPARLVALPTPQGDFERAPVRYAWPLDPQRELSEAEPFQAESREFWQTVDAAKLKRGFDVDLSAPGALIRVTPAKGARALQQPDVRLLGNGRAVAMAPTASATQLRAAGMAVPAGTVVMKIADDHGSGRYHLQSQAADGRYIVHVFEPGSPVALLARADRSHALVGDTIGLDVAMNDAGREQQAQAGALLVSPDGTSRPIGLRSDGSHLRAKVRIPADAGHLPGLWELQVFASGDNGIQRDARVAFAVSQPTARLAGDYTADRRARRVQVPVETATAGRYEVRGTLYATGPGKTLRPVAQGHSAAWFEPGRGVLALDFGTVKLPAGYGAPFELRQLELQDQIRGSLIEVRARAAKF